MNISSIGRGIKTWCFHGFTLSCMCVCELQCMCLDTHMGTHWHICILLYIFLFMWPVVAISHRCIPTGSENNSHQAISNLPFLSKIIEKAVYVQLNNYFNHWMCQNSVEQWKNWSNGLRCKGWTIKSQCTAVMLESTHQDRNLDVVIDLDLNF